MWMVACTHCEGHEVDGSSGSCKESCEADASGAAGQDEAVEGNGRDHMWPPCHVRDVH